MSLLSLARSVWRSVIRKGFHAVSDRVAWHSSALRSRSPRIRETWQGARSLQSAGKVAILVHFSRDGRFLSYFHYLLQQLDRAGFAVIVVSNSRKIDRKGVDKLLPFCASVVHRYNVGYDFGAWRDGLSRIPDLQKIDRLILANDSIFGPLQDLGEMIERCKPDRADIWSVTDSYSGRYHLQSYFMVINKAALTSAAFDKFWRIMRYVENKRVVIHKYEIGLSQAMLRAGLRLRALYPYTQLVEDVVLSTVREVDENDAEAADAPRISAYAQSLLSSVNEGQPLNPTHFFWEHLVLSAGCPFIKRDLLEKNPVRIPLLGNWRRTIAESSDYPIEMIEEYLQIASRDRVF
ncbi:MAG TPA: rhamnan synthesis F family protein [Aliidongia sp.]|nr:rhamnan synthesis F family protein [Aliidongia sp.]